MRQHCKKASFLLAKNSLLKTGSLFRFERVKQLDISKWSVSSRCSKSLFKELPQRNSDDRGFKFYSCIWWKRRGTSLCVTCHTCPVTLWCAALSDLICQHHTGNMMRWRWIWSFDERKTSLKNTGWKRKRTTINTLFLKKYYGVNLLFTDLLLDNLICDSLSSQHFSFCMSLCSLLFRKY